MKKLGLLGLTVGLCISVSAAEVPETANSTPPVDVAAEAAAHPLPPNGMCRSGRNAKARPARRHASQRPAAEVIPPETITPQAK